MTPILSLTFAPPRMATNGRSGFCNALPEILQFFLHKQPGRGLLHKFGDAHRGGMGAVRRAERVIDVVLGELGELLGKTFVIRLFFRVEAQVFEQERLSLFQFEGDFLGLRANALGAESDIFTARKFTIEQHAQALGNRLQAHLWIGFALGSSEMRSENETRTVAQSVLDRGQSFADAGVIHDAAIVERDVEVHAHEDAVIVEGQIANRKFGHGGFLSRRRVFFAGRSHSAL